MPKRTFSRPADRLKELDLNLLITLDALLRHASVTRAAEELDVSQSAVSHALARLRVLFGDELFIKSHNRMVPTPKALTLGGAISQIVTLARDTITRAVPFDPTTARRSI